MKHTQWAGRVGQEVAVTRNKMGYKVEGEFLRRVTTLLGGIPKPALTGWAAKSVAEYAVEHRASWETLPPTDAVKLLKGAPWSKRDDAADRGSAIHNAVEAYLTGEALPDGLTEDEFNCAVAVEAFLRQHVAKVLAVEMTVFSVTHQYAGTLDLWALGKDGMQWILDWKSSKGIYPDQAVQQTAYRHAEYAVIDKQLVATGGEAWNGRLIEWGPDKAQRIGLVHVRPDGATLHPVNCSDRLWTVFRAAAHVKLWQSDTDSYGRAPRERVFGQTVEYSPTTADAA